MGVQHSAQVALLPGIIVDEYLPQHMLVIEANGHYWHTRSGAPEKDELRCRRLEQAGYRVLVLCYS